MPPGFNHFSIIIILVIGIITARLAKKKERNPYLWGFLGAFFGIFALAFLWFIPSQKKEEIVSKKIVIEEPKSAQKFWYYLNEQNNHVGPMSFSALRKLFEEKTLSPETLVWHEEMLDWKQMNDLEEYKFFQI